MIACPPPFTPFRHAWLRLLPSHSLKEFNWRRSESKPSSLVSCRAIRKKAIVNRAWFLPVRASVALPLIYALHSLKLGYGSEKWKKNLTSCWVSSSLSNRKVNFSTTFARWNLLFARLALILISVTHCLKVRGTSEIFKLIWYFYRFAVSLSHPRGEILGSRMRFLLYPIR